MEARRARARLVTADSARGLLGRCLAAIDDFPVHIERMLSETIVAREASPAKFNRDRYRVVRECLVVALLRGRESVERLRVDEVVFVVCFVADDPMLRGHLCLVSEALAS